MELTPQELADKIGCSKITAWVYAGRYAHIYKYRKGRITYYAGIKAEDIKEMKRLYKNAIKKNGYKGKNEH